jgi:hypothetical protein
VYHYVDEEEDEEEDEGVQNAIAEWNRRVTSSEETHTTPPSPERSAPLKVLTPSARQLSPLSPDVTILLQEDGSIRVLHKGVGVLELTEPEAH